MFEAFVERLFFEYLPMIMIIALTLYLIIIQFIHVHPHVAYFACYPQYNIPHFFILRICFSEFVFSWDFIFRSTANGSVSFISGSFSHDLAAHRSIARRGLGHGRCRVSPDIVRFAYGWHAGFFPLWVSGCLQRSNCPCFYYFHLSFWLTSSPSSALALYDHTVNPELVLFQ